MKQASRKQGFDSTQHQLSLRAREGFMILTGSVAIFLLLSFLTYHHGDPAWSTTGNVIHVANAGGYVGAYLADFFLYFFGYVAYLFPAILAYCGWNAVRRGYLLPGTPSFSWVSQFAGFLMIFIACCGLFYLQLGNLRLHIPFSSGGILGDQLGSALKMHFNEAGSTIVLMAIGGFGCVLLTGMSWMQVLDWIGRVLLGMAKAMVSWYRMRRTEEAYLPEPLDSKNQRQEPILELDMGLTQQKTRKIAVRRAKEAEPIFTAIALPAMDKSASTEGISIEKTSLKTMQNLQAGSASPISISAPAELKIAHLSPQEISPAPKESPRPVAARVLRSVPVTGELPPIDLLDPAESTGKPLHFSSERLEVMSRDVELRLKEFGVEVRVVAVHPGPVITRFEMQLAPGVKVSRISTLAKDLARSLSVTSVRVVEVIPGRPVVGLEVPNESREVVRLREILASEPYEQMRSPLALALGKDIAGHPAVVDLAKMPHLLVAGTTGSGKSVGLNAMLIGLLYKATPQFLRMILIDPKMLELSIYEGIPHLLTPVVTDMKEAANALRWCVAEMERRYRLMAGVGVRNLSGYNQKVTDAAEQGEPIANPLHRTAPETQPEFLEAMPFVVVVIDEFADMMMVVGKKVEQLIARIAQKARAAGIHLVLATQRPSVDVITGLIKANIPTRIAFQVSSKIDSRTVLDQGGAEQLLGHGDMLYLPPGTSVPVRVHGAFVADDEVHRVVDNWKQRGQPEYIDEITRDLSEEGESGEGGEANSDGEQDPLYDQAVHIVTLSRRASISNLQRRLKIGYNRAARLIEDMEKTGIVSEMESNGSREVLAPPPPEA